MKRKRTGRPPVHGGHSLVYKTETIRSQLRIARYLGESFEELVSDLGPGEKNLTRAQKLLIDRVISKTGSISLIERYLSKNGVFVAPGVLHPIFERYLQLSRELRSDLLALGIHVRKEEPFDIVAYAREKYGGRAEETQEIAQDASEKVPPSSGPGEPEKPQGGGNSIYSPEHREGESGGEPNHSEGGNDDGDERTD